MTTLGVGAAATGGAATTAGLNINKLSMSAKNQKHWELMKDVHFLLIFHVLVKKKMVDLATSG